jgi:hypothetical protein
MSLFYKSRSAGKRNPRDVFLTCCDGKHIRTNAMQHGQEYQFIIKGNAVRFRNADLNRACRITSAMTALLLPGPMIAVVIQMEYVAGSLLNVREALFYL